MKDYTYSEIGMLAGAALGGSFSVIGILVSSTVLTFTIAGLGITAGVVIGGWMEKRKAGECEDWADEDIFGDVSPKYSDHSNNTVECTE